MRFVLGVLLGFGVGLGAAILFAPDKGKRAEWPPLIPEDKKGAAGTENGAGGLMAGVRQRIDEAMSEAREAKKRAEREMLDRYERSTGRKSDK
jgi:hypothetical protein